MDKAQAQTVVDWILATKSHVIDESLLSENGGGGGDQDLPLFLDLDMSILGSDRQGKMIKHRPPFIRK